MKQWTRSKIPLRLATHLSVYTRSKANAWVELALLFRKGLHQEFVTVASSSTARVYRKRVPFVNQTCYFKEYLKRDAWDPLKDLFRASRAKRALRSEEEATKQGFHLPRSLCLIEEYRWGIRTYCALVTESIDEAKSVRDQIRLQREKTTEASRSKRKLLSAFGREVGTWHAAGFHHGDLRLGNVLYQPNRGFSWLDNERNQRYRRLPLRQRVHNLTQINFEPLGLSKTDKMRFWRPYASLQKFTRYEERKVIKRVLKKTRKRRRKRGWT